MDIYIVIGLVVLVGVLLLRKRSSTPRKENPPWQEEEQDPPSHKVEPIEYPVTIYKDGVQMKGRAIEMPQGLQVFDENGTLMVDVTTRLTKLLGKFETNGVNGSITDARLAGHEHWAAADYDVYPVLFDAEGTCVEPKITRSGNVISWTYAALPGRSVNHVFYYGVY